jgi:hypothetical protein
LLPLKAPAGSSLEAFEIARKAELEPMDGLEDRAADGAVGDKAQSSREKDEPNEDEEETDKDDEEEDEEGEGWEDDETEGSTIGAWLRARRAVTRATRTLLQGGGQMQ